MKPDKKLRDKNRLTLTAKEETLKEFLINKYNNGDNFFDLKGEDVGTYIKLRDKDEWVHVNTIDPVGSDSLIRKIEALNYNKDSDKYIHIVTVQFID